MNYYNPYFSLYPYASVPTSTSTGLLSGLFKKGINFSSILSNAQRALGIVNQTIPMVKQFSPIIKNAKTMFRVMSEFKKIDLSAKEVASNSKEANVNESESKKTNKQIYENGPTFFI